jgi:hypothetical protein
MVFCLAVLKLKSINANLYYQILTLLSGAKYKESVGFILKAV